MADDRAYRIQLVFDAASEGYRALVPELEIDVHGASRAEAIQAAETEIESKVEAVATSGENLPAPIDGTPPEPGEVTLLLNGVLYRELTFQAQRAGVELEALAEQLVAAGLGGLDGRRAPRAPRPERGPAKKDREADEDRQPERNDGRGRGRGGNKGRGNQGNQGNRGRGGPRREGYRPEMENQADFLAYVRDQEKGGRRR